MATLYITEYENLAPIDHGVFLTGAGQETGDVTRQTVTYTTSTASAAFAATTRFIRVMASADAFVDFGAAPAAVATEHKIIADTEYFFGVMGGHKVAVYDGLS